LKKKKLKIPEPTLIPPPDEPFANKKEYVYPNFFIISFFINSND
jgi:hypothetical protein